MKKIYLILTAALLSATQLFAASTVTVNDVIGRFSGGLNIGADAQTGEVVLLPGSADGKVTLVLPDFNFGGLPLGDIVVTNASLSSTGAVSGITEYPLYIPFLKTRALVSINPRSSKLTASTAKLNLTINVTGLDPIPVTFDGERIAKNFQMPNAGFENNWHTVNKGVEPEYWHSFNSGTGDFISSTQDNTQLTESNDVRPGSTGNKSALIKSRYIVIARANGNFTNGQINAASWTATDGQNNYNFSDPSNNGFNTTFTATPDSIAFWAKYIPVSGTNTTKARMHAIITTNAYYKDPEDGGSYDNVKVAEAAINYDPTNGWKRLCVPFEYSNVGADKAAYILINFTTNQTPGGGNTSSSNVDQLYLDDVEMIYNANLKSLSIGNEAILFTNGNANSTQTYCDSCYTADVALDGTGAAAYVGYNAVNNQMLVYVTPNNYAESKAYKLYIVTMKENDATAIDNTKAEIKVKKLVMNGQVLIIRDNIWYDMLGNRVR